MIPAFRPATTDDLETVIPLMARLYARAGLDEARARGACHDLLAHPEFGGLWLIQAGSETAGYLVITICYSLEFYGRFALLDELFVDAAWRGNGIGTQALAFAGEFARTRGLRAIRLEVAWENARGRELYTRCGFQLDERNLMTRWLAPPPAIIG